MTTIYALKRAISAYDEVLTNLETNKDPRFWKPYHVCLLTMAMRESAKKGNFNPANYQFIGQKTEAIRYLSRMHLWKCLDVEPPIEVPENDHTGRFMPLMRLNDRDKISSISSQLEALMKNSARGSADSAKTMLEELLDNCFSHSEIDDGMFGLVCAQHWAGNNSSQIAILDRGIGIRQSLSSALNPIDDLDSKNACELATEYEVSSKLGDGHSGYGLTLARGIIQNNGGVFFLASGNEYYFSKRGLDESGTLDTPFQGTLIVLEWNTQVELSSKDVYDSWSSMEVDYDFDF